MNRKIIFWILLVAFFWIIISRLVQIENLFKVLARGQSEWIVLAALLQFAFYAAYTAIYQTALYSVGLKKPGLLHLLPLSFAAVFVNVIAPSGGAAGAALFVDDAARRGESPARATAGVIVKTLADFSAITLILLFGMLYLSSKGNLRSYQLLGAVIFLLILVSLAGMLMLGMKRPSALGRLFGGIQRGIDGISMRIRRRPALSACWAEQSTDEFVRAAETIMAHPTRPGHPVLFSLVSHTLNILSLYAIFRAFQTPVDPGTLIAGYSMALLFLIVSITPMGIGVVEGSMVLVFQSLGVPGGVATVVSLAFRGIGFWLPFLIGFLVLRRVKAFS